MRPVDIVRNVVHAIRIISLFLLTMDFFNDFACDNRVNEVIEELNIKNCKLISHKHVTEHLVSMNNNTTYA